MLISSQEAIAASRSAGESGKRLNVSVPNWRAAMDNPRNQFLFEPFELFLDERASVIAVLHGCLNWHNAPRTHLQLPNESCSAHSALLGTDRNKTSVWRFISMTFEMISAAMGRYSPRQSGPMVHK
jgi:hypothetical protein